MDWKNLQDVPPWEWPEDAGPALLAVLRDKDASDADRLVAAELAGESVVAGDEIATALLAIVRNTEASEELRGQAAISLGPILEEYDLYGSGDEVMEASIREGTFQAIRKGLRAVFADAVTPKHVRRCALEGSVRASQDWHEPAVRAAFASGDEDWKQTAVFCMRFVPDFDDEIMASLRSENEGILRQAILAAGGCELASAWPRIRELIASGTLEKPTLLAAIEAAGSIHAPDVHEVLEEFLHSDDEDIAEVAEEALTCADGAADAGGPDDDEFRGEDDREEPVQQRIVEKVGRNQPCPCGSGKKYKKCCGK
jgi:hypothetical protein